MCASLCLVCCRTLCGRDVLRLALSCCSPWKLSGCVSVDLLWALPCISVFKPVSHCLYYCCQKAKKAPKLSGPGRLIAKPESSGPLWSGEQSQGLSYRLGGLWLHLFGGVFGGLLRGRVGEGRACGLVMCPPENGGGLSKMKAQSLWDGRGLIQNGSAPVCAARA